MKKTEFEKRLAEIEAAEPETMTPEEEKSLHAAQAINDGETVDYDEFIQSLEDYSGRLVLRIPRSLHKALKEAAAIEGVSLNQYMLYKLAK